MANAKFRVKNGLIVDEVASNSGNFTILDGTVTSDAGITLATGSDGNIALSPDAGGKVTIDEPSQCPVAPGAAQSPYLAIFMLLRTAQPANDCQQPYHLGSVAPGSPIIFVLVFLVWFTLLVG